MPSLEELLDEAILQEEPQVIAFSKSSPGGVDPLGLRQINFSLMDRVLPDLNNVARHIRPYIVMAWGWRRVKTVVETAGLKGASDAEMRDFVDRIEAIYAWSQFLNDARTDLPGRQAMHNLLSASSYLFAGEEWQGRRDMRRYSTGLISPLNYGPSLRTMGWLLPVDQGSGVFQPDPSLKAVLDRFEHAIRDELEHEAFSRFGAVTVTTEEASRWGRLWAMSDIPEIEAEAMYHRLGGARASSVRREGIALLVAAHADLSESQPSADSIRMRMADPPQAWNDPARRPAISDAWRELQVRQLFRLALESFFYWTIGVLMPGPMRSSQIAQLFLDHLSRGTPLPEAAADWILAPVATRSPITPLRSIQDALQGRPFDAMRLTAAIVNGLAFCLNEAPDRPHPFESADRLPLSRARHNANCWKNLTPLDFTTRMLEGWIMSQHAYWSVGRGLADARAGGKQILRLRIVMDEGGWTLTPGTTKIGNPPEPTPDRLETAISLLRECGKLQAH